MSQCLTTRISLLLRIRNPQDSSSWRDFVKLYAPIIYQYGRRMGLQDADAADVTQEVLTAVAKSIGNFDYDRKLGRFRGWLKTIAHNALCRVKRRQYREPVIDNSAVFNRAAAVGVETDSRFWDDQYARRMFQFASQKVKAHVQPASWEAFAATTLRSENPDAVAKRLGLTVGAVYVAKSRVYSRVRDVLREIDEHS